MASPRRSRRFKLSPKPKLPEKPRRPKRVKNPAEDSVRQANYQVELAAWEAAKVEHEKLMQKRKAKQNATTAAARKSDVEKSLPLSPPGRAHPPPQLTAEEWQLARQPDPPGRGWSRSWS